MEQKNNKKIKNLIVIISLLFAVLIFGAVYFVFHLNRVTTDDAYIDGRVHTIASKVPGTVKSLFVTDNQQVKKGDLLLEIDPADYEVKVNEAQAALDAEKSKLLDAEAGIRTAEAAVEIQDVTLRQATLDKKRAENLFKEQVITQERFEKVSTAFDLSSAQLKAAQEQLEKAKSTRDLEAALIKQKESVLQIALLNLSYCKISASADGYITKKSVETGNQIQSGQPLMAVVALDDIWITANYKETQVKNVRPGQSVVIKVDTYPGVMFKGTVDSVMAGTGSVFSLFPPENALGNYVKVVQRVPVKIVFDKDSTKDRALRIGMSVVPSILSR